MLVSPARARTLLHSLSLCILYPLTLASAITLLASLILCLIAAIPLNAQETTAIQPEIHLPTEATDQLSKSIDPLMQQALTQGEMSGAVLTIVHQDAVIFEKAYGWRHQANCNGLMYHEVSGK